MPRPFCPGKGPVPTVQKAGWASGPVWTCAENLASTGIRSVDRPARSQWLRIGMGGRHLYGKELSGFIKMLGIS
jgi:hypothetical protein